MYTAKQTTTGWKVFDNNGQAASIDQSEAQAKYLASIFNAIVKEI